jgi:hypothetical protein
MSSFWPVLSCEEGDHHMSQLDQWQAHQPYTGLTGKQDWSNRAEGDSSTFVNPLPVGSSHSYSPYGFSTETAIPPPPPGIDTPVIPQSKRNTGYLVALVVLSVLVVVLGSLELLQVATQTPGVPDPSASAGSHQVNTIRTQHVAPHMSKLTPGTMKENVLLTCSGCDDPVLTTITSITVDTTNLRTMWTMKLKNVSGAQQIDYFAEFNLQDPFGNIYEGTGNLNTNYILDAGQTALKTEIFSFLPGPGTSYTLIARLGISGITYDPFQVTF